MAAYTEPSFTGVLPEISTAVILHQTRLRWTGRAAELSGGKRTPSYATTPPTQYGLLDFDVIIGRSHRGGGGYLSTENVAYWHTAGRGISDGLSAAGES